MWVSRKRFEALEAKVDAMERGSRFSVYVGDEHPDRYFIHLNAHDVLRAVIDYLGVKLGVQHATPERAVIVPKVKAK
jgi:hypothetical protein